MDTTTRLHYLNQRLLEIEQQAQTCRERTAAQRLLVEWHLLSEVSKTVAKGVA